MFYCYYFGEFHQGNPKSRYYVKKTIYSRKIHFAASAYNSYCCSCRLHDNVNFILMMRQTQTSVLPEYFYLMNKSFKRFLHRSADMLKRNRFNENFQLKIEKHLSYSTIKRDGKRRSGRG